jgi:hypothetical protein
MPIILKDPVHEHIILGIAASAAVAIHRARETNTPLIVWQND